MKKKKMLIVDEETGEVVMERLLKDFSRAEKVKISKKMVDEMLNNTRGDLTRIDVHMLYQWCMITKEMNTYRQMLLKGVFQQDSIYKRILAMNFGLHVLRCLATANKYSCFMKESPKKFIDSWKGLFEVVEISSPKTQRSVKKFLVENKLVREYSHIGRDGKRKKKFIVNPFLFRSSAYVSEIAINQFQDFVEEGRNVSIYIMRLLQCKEVIEEE